MLNPSDEDEKMSWTCVLLATHVKDPKAVANRRRVGEVSPDCLAKLTDGAHCVTIGKTPKHHTPPSAGLDSAALAVAVALFRKDDPNFLRRINK